MTPRNAIGRWTAAATLALGLLASAGTASAHCDTLDGPVVGAARRALDTGNVNLVLAWVQEDDEAEIRTRFRDVLAVRKAGGQAAALADAYFFETLVRVHRAGEGAGYTGLKPAGAIEPSVAAADRALASGSPAAVARLVSERMEHGLHRHFEDVASKRGYDPNDLEAGRKFVTAYVEYTHYVERLYNASDAPSAGHAPKAARGEAHAH